MPGFDGTGPRGMGSRTGWGRGFCPPFGPARYPYQPTGSYPVAAQWPMPPAPAYRSAMWPGQPPNPSYGGAPYAPQVTREQELDYLKSQADMLRGQLDQIESRVSELGKTPE